MDSMCTHNTADLLKWAYATLLIQVLSPKHATTPQHCRLNITTANNDTTLNSIDNIPNNSAIEQAKH